jgi:MFS family permease
LNAVGRIAAGWAGDKAGTVNVLLTFNFMSGLMCVVIWIFAKTYGTMMAFAACWGFFCGGERRIQPTCSFLLPLYSIY